MSLRYNKNSNRNYATIIIYIWAIDSNIDEKNAKYSCCATAAQRAFLLVGSNTDHRSQP